MGCKVVCISHATGAGGDDVGRLVADRLGFLYVNEEIVADAAARGGVEPRDVAEEERRKSLAARILDALAESGGETIALGGAVAYRNADEPTSADIRELIRETIAQTAARGDVVISAHAASFALEPRADVLRVFVTASADIRAKRVGSQDGMDGSRARRAVSDADAGRRDYLKRFYDVDTELPTHYDLVVNTDVLSPEDAAEIVTRVATR